MKITFSKTILFILASLSLLPSCGGSGNVTSSGEGDEIPMRYARNLSMRELAEGVTIAEFRNPWDTTRTLQRIIMIERGRDVPADLPEGTVVKTPLSRSVVYTGVHATLLEELGKAGSIAGICDVDYLTNKDIKKLVAEGAIADCGKSMAPNIERIVRLNPDAILLSAFENSNDHNKVAQLGIPIIDCPDYMELSPLGRAEWMRFFGRLYGAGEKADSIFNATEKAYLDIKRKAADVTTRPKVLTEKIYGQSWDVPGANSTVGVMIADAGGSVPFPEYTASGSVRLAPEEVLYKGRDADIWLIKYMQKVPLTLTLLAQENPIYSQFDAFKKGNVFGLDTETTPYFEVAAFHPDRVLAEFMELLHPELGAVAGNPHFYHLLER